MNFTENLQKVMENAVRLAEKEHHRYFLPEHMIYGLTFDKEFIEEFEEGGGGVKLLRKDILGFLTANVDKIEKAKRKVQLTLTRDSEQVLSMAEGQARSSGRSAVDVCHLLSAILRLQDSYGLYYLMAQDVDLMEIIGNMSRNSLAAERGREENRWSSPHKDSENGEEDKDWQSEANRKEGDEKMSKKHQKQEEESASGREQRWKNFVEEMNETCQNQNPLIGREEEMERTIQILCRKDKNNVLHIGEPGVGKTALAYGLAQKIIQKDVPEPLLGARLYALDLSGLLAGTQYRGDFEKRFKKIMEGLSREERPILYLDEIHNIVGAGAVNGGSMDVANLLKPYLAAGHIRFIGATTYEEYKKHILNSKSLVRRFQNVDIQEPSKEEAVAILTGLKSGYEAFHGINYEEGVLEHAVQVSSRYINERFLPDKAIDLIDEAGAYRRLHPLAKEQPAKQTVDKLLIDQVLAKICKIPPQTMEKGEMENLARLESQLKQQIFGQDKAIAQVANAVKFSKAGLNEEDKPIASFLFVGATGVGKTELAKALAAEMGIDFLRFDMSEYAEKHTIAKLIGAPAGYVGYEEGGILTEEIRRHPHAVLLLDEIEKAHADIFNVLLQVMDYATLSDNQGRKADFRNIILIMTSNAGASQVGKSQIGFGSAAVNMEALLDAVKRTFQPEFRNRLSRIILFSSLDEEMAKQITHKKLGELQQKLTARGVKFTVTSEGEEYIRKAGITQEYGAREIDRIIFSEVKPLLAERLLFGDLKEGGSCILDIEKEKLILR